MRSSLEWASTAGPWSLIWLFAFTLSGCVPAPGPPVLPHIFGTVFDRETGEGISEATVLVSYKEYDWFGGGGIAYQHEDLATTDADGHFEIPWHLSPNVWMWLFLNERLPVQVYHASYGHLYGLRPQGNPWTFELSLLHSRFDAAWERCAEEWDRSEIKNVACPPGHDQASHPNGQRRYTGQTNRMGKRHGDFVFFRADGSVLAKGFYWHGKAAAKWDFFDATGHRSRTLGCSLPGEIDPGPPVALRYRDGWVRVAPFELPEPTRPCPDSEIPVSSPPASSPRSPSGSR